MRIGSLFAGIGGLELGLERAGVGETIWQVERDPYASAVLAKHWPHARRHDDVTTFPPATGDWSADVICGGFPCQDLSYAGKGAGIDGARSGLWREFARIVRVLRPSFVVVENVPALLSRGLGRVLRDLAACGFDAEWRCVSAASVGANHRRDRFFMVAYAAHHDVARRGHPRTNQWHAERDESVPVRSGKALADDDDERLQTCLPAGDSGRENAAHESVIEYGEISSPRKRDGDRRTWWITEPSVGRVAHGVPSRVDRLRCLGNAVVPQVAEVVGRRLLEIERRLK